MHSSSAVQLNFLPSQIIGTGRYLPANSVSNTQLVHKLAQLGVETDDEWITSRTGITARHYANSQETTSYMAAMAASTALAKAGLPANCIDMIIVATSTPDSVFPSTACQVQKQLGIEKSIIAFDLQAACSGMVYALTTAHSFMQTGMAKTVLVIGSEVFSRLLDFTDRTTCVLFGDGAAAILLSCEESLTKQQPNSGIVACKLHAKGQFDEALHLNCHLNQGQLIGKPYLSMQGQDVFKLAVQSLQSLTQELLDLSHWQANEVDCFIPHQANIRIMQSCAQKFGWEERLIATVQQHGNTSAASIGLALDYAIEHNQLKKGDKLILEGMGAGFTWGGLSLIY